MSVRRPHVRLIERDEEYLFQIRVSSDDSAFNDVFMIFEKGTPIREVVSDVCDAISQALDQHFQGGDL